MSRITDTFDELLPGYDVGRLTTGEFARLYRDFMVGGRRRSARLAFLDLATEVADETVKAVVTEPFSEGKIHKVEDIGDDTYTIFRKGKGKAQTYALYRNADLLIDWKPSPRDAENRIKIESMRYTRGKSKLLLAEDPETKRLKKIPEWGLF